jgi:hypothetical protein
MGCLLPGYLAAQRGPGSGHGGGGGAGIPGGPGMRPVRPSTPAGFTPARGNHWGREWGYGMSTLGAGWWPPYYSSAAYAPPYFMDGSMGNRYGYQAPPTIVIVMSQPAAPEPPPPPPSPARPQTHEYSWSDSGNGSPSALAILLKDGTSRAAVAVCVQDGFLTYVAPNGDGGRVDVNAVDREGTRRANARLRL